MTGPTARVLSLPTEYDVRDEAERLGVPFTDLEMLVGAVGLQAVKLEMVSPAVAAALKTMVPDTLGLVVASDAGTKHEAQGDSYQLSAISHQLSASSAQDLEQDPGPSTQNSEPRTQNSELRPGLRAQDSAPSGCVDVVIAAPLPLLMDVAARLAVGGEDEKATAEALRITLDRYQGKQLGTTRCGNLNLEWGKRSYIMGIINVTPDSFSGDGLGTNLEAAVEQGRRFVEEGADILDVGGESTRPGSEPVPVKEELARVVPVIRRLAQEVSVPISVDSYKLLVVQEALEAGASMINDVWGLRRTEGLGSLAAAYDVPIVLMHNRRGEATRSAIGGHFKQVQYRDLMGEIVQGLRESVELALQSNVKWENIIVDPGLGFGKTPPQNLVVMRRLAELKSLGRPILMGSSRKSVIGLVLNLPPEERVEGTAATVAISIANGADIIRVHDVKEMARVARMTDAIVRAPAEA